MQKSNPPKQEVVGDSLAEDISQLQQISLGEGAATCQVCGSPLHEGDAVVVYAFRPTGAVRFQVGHVICGGDQHDHPSEYTLGVRELIVAGRVGRCSDSVTQSSWPVLLAPEVVGVSAAATKSLRRIPIANPDDKTTTETDPRASPPTDTPRCHTPLTEPAHPLRGDGQ